ncbi:MAG: hypothetical protein HUU10_04920 [Bacteroidetes bacterium]|nr:hypothetical protein [Bacteroidota bacterium]
MFFLIGLLATISLMILAFLWRRQRRSDHSIRGSKNRLLDRRRRRMS